MLKLVSKIISYAGLVLTLIPSFLVYASLSVAFDTEEEIIVLFALITIPSIFYLLLIWAFIMPTILKKTYTVFFS